jgi:hypothetical protein
MAAAGRTGALLTCIALVLIVPLGSHQGFPVGQHSTDEIFPLLSGQSGYPFAEWFQHSPTSMTAVFVACVRRPWLSLTSLRAGQCVGLVFSRHGFFLVVMFLTSNKIRRWQDCIDEIAKPA